jgi:hypothetical protein
MKVKAMLGMDGLEAIRDAFDRCHLSIFGRGRPHSLGG